MSAFAEAGAGEQEVGGVAGGAEVDVGVEIAGPDDVAALLGATEQPPAGQDGSESYQAPVFAK